MKSNLPELPGESFGAVYVLPETAHEIRVEIRGLERFIGCLLIGYMPDRGLAEALHTLHEVYTFYMERPPQRRLPLPRKIVQATIVDRKKRPGLTITD